MLLLLLLLVKGSAIHRSTVLSSDFAAGFALTIVTFVPASALAESMVLDTLKAQDPLLPACVGTVFPYCHV